MAWSAANPHPLPRLSRTPVLVPVGAKPQARALPLSARLMPRRVVDYLMRLPCSRRGRPRCLSTLMGCISPQMRSTSSWNRSLRPSSNSSRNNRMKSGSDRVKQGSNLPRQPHLAISHPARLLSHHLRRTATHLLKAFLRPRRAHKRSLTTGWKCSPRSRQATRTRRASARTLLLPPPRLLLPVPLEPLASTSQSLVRLHIRRRLRCRGRRARQCGYRTI